MKADDQSPQRLELWVGDPTTADEATVEGARALLDDDERARIDTLSNPARRKEQTLVRAGVRGALSGLTGQPASALRFVTEGRGKPMLAPGCQPPGAAPLQFNLSHCVGLLAIAATRARRVGLDVERPRSHPSWRRIARRYFSAAEVGALEARPAERAEAAFFACWVRKEALVKASGGGIASGLSSFDVNVEPDRPARLLGSRSAALALDRWTLLDLEPAPGYRACLAVEGKAPVQLSWNGIPWPVPGKSVPGPKRPRSP